MTKTNLAIVFAVASILGTTALAFNLVNTSPRSYGTPEAVAAVATEYPPGPSTSANQDIEVEVITATPAGFEPAMITRSRGPFILALHNTSGERELDFRIYRAQGQQLQQLRLPPGRRANHRRLDLPPGDYVVAEANHPEWTCALTITH